MGTQTTGGLRALKLLRTGCIVGLTLPSAVAAQNAATDARANPSVEDQRGAEAANGEIIVTATRRAERLLDIPQAVTAIDEKSLEAGGVRNFADYARLVPGLTNSDLGTGRARVTIRGINVNTGAPAVGYYIDETPIPSSAGSVRLVTIDPRLFDVERIEVLRGPQGTLFGASSMGGTIRIITNRADPSRVEGAARLTADTAATGGFGTAGDVMINFPLVEDKLAIRAVGWARHADGFITRRVDGQRVAKAPAQDVYGFRVKAGATLGDLKLEAGVFHEKQKFNGFQTVTFGANNPNGKLEQNLRFDIAEPNINKFTIANLTATLDLGFGSLQSSSSYYDGGLSATEETAELLAAFVGPTFPSSITESPKKRAVTQEIRLTSQQPIAGIGYTVGFFYSKERLRRRSDLVVPEYLSIVGTQNLFIGRYRSELKQVAGFGEVNAEPLQGLKLTAGGRYYDVSGFDAAMADGLFNGGLSTSTAKFAKTGIVTRFTASYKVDRNAQIYAQAAQGFRPGFGSVPPPALCDADLAAIGLDRSKLQVDPDKVWNYEVGAKAASANGRLRGSLAAYRIDWSKIQLGVFLPCGFRFASNAGDARVQGVELEGSALLTDDFQIGGSLSYTDAKFKQVSPGTDARAGDPILEVPKWQGAAFAQLGFRLASTTTGFLRLDAQYTGKSLLFYSTDQATAPAPLSFRSRPDLTLVNARLQFDRDKYSIALFGRNLLNQVKVIGFGDSISANLSYRPRLAVNQPRTIGVEFNIRY